MSSKQKEGPGQRKGRKETAGAMAADAGVNPLGNSRGRPSGNVAEVNSRPTGNSAAYLVRRLKRDAPAIAEALARGEYPSARAAAIAAGIVHVPKPLDMAKKSYLKLSKRERAKFIKWISEQNQEED
jgi:hypothetical protein